MQVQIYNYLSLIKEFKIPLFIHGIGANIKEILNEIRNNIKRNFLSFLKSLMSHQECFIIMKLTKKVYQLEVNALLRKFEINFPGPYSCGSRKGFELRSFNEKEIKKFNKRIGFLHPIKRKRSTALIA